MRKKGEASKHEDEKTENGFEAGRKARANERPGKSQKANEIRSGSYTGNPLKLAALRQLRVFLRGSICLVCLVAMAFFCPPPSGVMNGGESVGSCSGEEERKICTLLFAAGRWEAGVERCGICFIWLVLCGFRVGEWWRKRRCVALGEEERKDLHAALRSGSLVAGVGRCGICFIWLALCGFRVYKWWQREDAWFRSEGRICTLLFAAGRWVA